MLGILEGIGKNNAETVDILKGIKGRLHEKGVKTGVKFTYIIGIHDWLFNEYQSTRDRFRATQGMSLSNIASLPLKWIGRFEDTFQDYGSHAHDEPGGAEYIVYGHTHKHVIEPLDLVVDGSGKQSRRIYINSGTWRKSHTRVTRDSLNYEFTGCHVMMFIAFYRREERGENRFEVWSGALGKDTLKIRKSKD